MDLCDYAGQTVRIAFYHAADGSINGPGWYIDSVSITGVVEPGTLNVNKDGTGDGIVTCNPPGIDCGTKCSETYPYPPSTTVDLTPVSDANSIFVGWSGCDSLMGDVCRVTMDGSNRTVTATF